MSGPFAEVQPDDPPMAFCEQHHTKYNPYRSDCWQCKRESIHESARAEWSEIKRERIDIELEPLTEQGMIPSDWEGDAFVKWGGDSRLLRIQETRPAENSVACRYFTIEGGFPVSWLDDELVDALAEEMGRRMMSVVKFV